MSEFQVGTEIQTLTGQVVATVTKVQTAGFNLPIVTLDGQLLRPEESTYAGDALNGLIERLDLVVVPPKPKPREFEPGCAAVKDGWFYWRGPNYWYRLEGRDVSHIWLPDVRMPDAIRGATVFWPDGHMEELA